MRETKRKGELGRKHQEGILKEVESREDEEMHLIETERALAGVRKEASPTQEGIPRRYTDEQNVGARVYEGVRM